jgi:tRNA A-37 threonylcarbamoyl transferase component Bud32
MRYCPTCAERYPDEVAFCPEHGVETKPLEEEQTVDPLLGRVVDGRYRIEKAIGRGGMGVVYLATHAVLSKKLAIKVLKGQMAKDEETVQRFRQEALAVTAIGHEHIVDITDFGRLPDGAAYFVMEYLEGMALTDLVQRGGSLPMADAIGIVIQIASALGAAHARGVVHRDLKPDNVFLINRGNSSRFVKVLDFGIAKVGGASSRLTKTGMVFGTPHYMAPEQAAGQPVDARTDIYALGVMMYEMFTGKVPFDADTFMGILSKHMFEPPVPPSTHNSQLGVLEDVILTALAKKQEDRYQTMDELVAALKAIVPSGMITVGARGPNGSVPAPSLADALEPPSRTEARLTAPKIPRSRTPIVLVGAIAAAVVVLGIVGVAFALGAFDGTDASGRLDSIATEPVVSPPEPVEPPEPPEPPEPVREEMRVVVIDTEPAGAEVLIDGAIVGNTPARVPLPDEGVTSNLEVRFRGYVPQEIQLSSASPENIRVTLEPARDRPVRAGMQEAMVEEPMIEVVEAMMEQVQVPVMETSMMTTMSTFSEVVDPWELE